MSVENEGTTKLTVRLKPVPMPGPMKCVSINGDGHTGGVTVDSTQARRIVVGNLTPGTTYNLAARAIGGSEGYSEWSDPVSHMAI